MKGKQRRSRKGSTVDNFSSQFFCWSVWCVTLTSCQTIWLENSFFPQLNSMCARKLKFIKFLSFYKKISKPILVKCVRNTEHNQAKLRRETNKTKQNKKQAQSE